MHSKHIFLLIFVSSFIIQACAPHAPYAQNISQYRAQFLNQEKGFTTGYETYMMSRSLKEVEKSLKGFLAQCKDLSSNYKIKLIKKSHRLELHLQQENHSFSKFFNDTEPEGGSYKILIDIYRNSEQSVKVDFYTKSSHETKLVLMIKKWIKGESSCQ